MVPLPEQAGCKPKLQLIEYDAHSFQEREIELADLESLHSSRVNWINVGGLGDVETLQKVGEHFRIHPLALEDVFNTGQRPHIDEYEKQLFIVLQMAYEETEGELVFEQVSLVLGDHRLFDLHSAHFYRWIVRHEHRQHARITLEVWLSSCPGDHVGCSRRHDPVLQAKELVVIAPTTAQKIAKTDFLNRRSQR